MIGVNTSTTLFGLDLTVLQGYGPLLLHGTWVTLKLSALALLVSIALGLLGAAAKLSPLRLLNLPATCYTTLIRGVPDLVLMLLIFYSLQGWLTALTELLDWPYMEIDPFVAGIITLGFIYGAYFTETFRGAMLSVPRGQQEAAAAFGLGRWQRFRFVVFPQMMRYALPSLGNNWLVLLKATALVSIIGLSDLVKVAQEAGKSTFNMLDFLLLAAALYLLITSASNQLLRLLERRYNQGVRGLSR
ncbi:histidine ABC transporter, permease protein HisQ [Pseudomonas sp. St29]|nr:histidine ABC transporter, permease protein HisQ [Pseudomonas sp. St29]